MSAARAAALLSAAAVGILLGALLPFLPPAAGLRASQEEPPLARRVLIEKDAAWAREARRLESAGLRVIGDYGRLVLAESTAPGGRALLRRAGVRIRREIEEGVRLRRRALAPVAGAGPSQAGGLHVVKLAGPARPGWVAALRSLPGVRILSPLPESAYLVWLPERSATALAALSSSLDLASRLDPLDRISPDLDGAAEPIRVAAYFIETPSGEAAAAAARDRSPGSRAVAPRLPGLRGEILSLSREDLEEISEWEELVWAEPWSAATLHDELSSMIAAGLVGGGLPTGPQYRGWLASAGLEDLSGWVVHVVDTGIDSGLSGAEHPALAGRVASAVNETLEAGNEDCVGHGTHIAGIVAGNPPAGSNLTDDDGFEYGLGLAPTARLAASRIFNCAGDLETRRSFTEIFTDAWERGARISNNSWGILGAAYSALASEFDAIVRDVNGDASDGEQPMVVVASSGNIGPLPYSLGSPALAKNVIAVGASESVRPEGTDGCGTGPLGADDPDQLRPTSSRGPTSDGRVKPDLVAPGSHILSTVSQSKGYTGLGLCNTFHPPAQRLYTWTSGTSQAAAHVSGAAVLVMEDYRRRFGAAPSPAMVKAALVAAARDLGTGDEAFTEPISSRPSFDHGWGRIDLSGIIGRRDRVAEDQTHVFTSSGEEAVRGPFIVADPSRPAAVVLAWSDAPGTPAGSSWVNDLDLEVVSSSQTFLGNVMEDGFSVPGGSHDSRNNVEAVFLPAGSIGSFTVRITAVSIPGDGVPAADGWTDQDFALYVDNVTAAAPEGSIEMKSPETACGSAARVTVTSRWLAGADRIAAEATSGTEVLPESVDLAEEPPGSGIFNGEIQISPGAPSGDGRLQVADGDTILVAFPHPDTGTGSPTMLTASATARCSPLSISDVGISAVGPTRALVTWRTSRPSDSLASAGPGAEAADASLVTDHRLLLAGLSPCTSYALTVASTDAAGARTTAPASGSFLFSTGSTLRMPLLRDDLEALTTRWSHGGAGDEWEVGSPQTGPPAATSGQRVWGTDLDGAYDEESDSHLTLPPLNLHGFRDPVLTFRHYFDIPRAVTPGDPQDGAWIEASIDGGQSWFVLAPDGGYPADAGPNNPYLPVGSGVFAGRTFNWSDVRIDLSSLRGGAALVRFRLWRDPAGSSPPGAGWYIDDVVVESSVPCGVGTLLLDAPDYGCDSLVNVVLADEDVDRDPSQTGFASIFAEVSGGPIAIQLRETTPSSRVYTGVLQLSAAGAPGTMPIAEGETLSIRYEDRDDGTGSPITVTTAVEVPDCTPPAPPDLLGIEPDDDGRLLVQWQDPPDPDLALVRIHYDSDASGPAYSGIGAAEGFSPLRAERGRSSAILSGLPSCSPQFVSLTAVDDHGNESAFAAEGVAVPFRGVPCARATILLAGASGAGCTQTLPVRVDDANADSPIQAGTLPIQVASPSDPAALAIQLPETGPSTGIYTGFIPLSPSAAPGKLRVSEGDEIVVTYLDTNTGSGAGAPLTASLPVDDCRSPLITDLGAPRLGFGGVRLDFRTDEPATALVEFGLDPGVEDSVAGDPLAISHSIDLPSPAECSTLHYRITATDRRGNASTADDGGLPFHVGTSRVLTLLSDDFESGAPGWTTDGSQDGWELGFPATTPPADPNFPPNGVWGTNLDGTYGVNADMRLVTPPIDLKGLDSAALIFRHWYDIHTSTPGAGFDDGAWVEVSTDGGGTWSYVTPDGGYPDVIETNPYIPGGSPVYAGQTPEWEDAVFQLDAFADHEILIRFHLFQDRLSPPDPGLGWYIDDVRIHAAAPCRQGRIHVDLGAGDCGDSPLAIRLWDADLDADPLVEETATVTIRSASDPIARGVILGETSASSGEFIATVPFSRSGGPGILRVLDGDVVTAAYDDGDDGTGAAAMAESTAIVRDCSPPLLTQPTWRRAGAAMIEIAWDSDELADAEVQMPPGTPVASSSDLSLHHKLLVPAPATCDEAFFAVASTDGGGNRAVADNGGGGFPIEASREVFILTEGFESGAPGWEHAGDPDEWEIGAPLLGPPGAFEGASVAGTDLDGTYDKDPDRQRHETLLLSPPFSLEGLQAATLSMMHFHRLVFGTRGDGGLVEVLDGGRWTALTPAGGYPGSVRTDRATGSLPAFVGSTQGWTESSFDLSPFLGRRIRIRLRLIVDHGTPGTDAGWYVDDVRVAGVVSCRRGLLLLDRDEYGCAATGASILVADADLDLEPLAAETLTVEASDGAAQVSVDLLETGVSTGVFRGEAPLSASGGPGALLLEEGVTITVSYADADDGSGAPASVEAMAAVRDCRPPAIRAARNDPAWSGAQAALRWETDEPSTTEAILLMPGRPPRKVTSLDLVTDHVARFHGLPACAPFSIVIASRDAAGNLAQADGPSPPFAGETRTEIVLFADDMEGQASAWSSFGRENEWQRGVPLVGPPGAFSGSRVFGTDLSGSYSAGTDSSLRTPRIDLSSVSSAALSVWHFWDVFADVTPNGDDDGAWIEVSTDAGETWTYVMPVEGYNNTIDRDGSPPIQGGSGVFAGSSGAWQRSVVDLTPFAGTEIRVQFHIWNDFVEGPINRATGTGWYIDDVKVAAPRTCFSAPQITSVSPGNLLQGDRDVAITVSGSHVREPFAFDAGAGIVIRDVAPAGAGSWSALADVDESAPAGPRALAVTNPDGQEGILPNAFRVNAQPARADIDGSGVVDAADLAILAASFGAFAGEPAYRAAADLSGDGIVDGADLALLASVFGSPFGP